MARKGDLKAIKITQCRYQQGHERISESQPPPRLAPFQNNLVAFSQYYDLCFVASQDRILVHSPISLELRLLPPRSIIHLASSNSGLAGYIDPRQPHSINQLAVADLGLEELVIAVTDDGDVVAYTTRSIRNEIHDRGLAYNTPCFRSTVRPYFLRNVGNSAWGIAVHQEARMIAVSSNSHKIHVFAFALGHFSSDSSDEDSDRQETASSELQPSCDGTEWEHSWDAPRPSDRSRNQELILVSHETNIPNLAFYNPYDRRIQDVFLASTDIHGSTYIWNVWKHIPLLQLMPSRGRIWGWGLLCIDPVFAQQAETTSELFGTEQDIDLKPPSVDITHALSHVPGYEDVHFSTRERRKNHAASDDLMDESTTDDDEDVGNDVDDLDDGDDAETGSSNDDSPGDEEDSPAIRGPSFNESKASAAANRKPRASTKASEPLKHFMFCVIHTTRRDVRLLQFLHKIPPVDTMVNWLPKEIICEYILDQHLHPYDRYLRNLQRLNMVHQVPELSLVIVGDQMGRVALLTITRRKAENGVDKLDDFGFRVEAFLPFGSQEDAGHRPKKNLLGVAVGPVQGHERQREDLFDAATGARLNRRRVTQSRPYRVMLYYSDHTVLNYEITRQEMAK